MQISANHDTTSKFEQIYQTYEKLMLSISVSILGPDDAYDAMQHCMIRLYSNLEKVGNVHDLRTRVFVCKIIKNEALRLYKSIKRKRSREIPLEHTDFTAESIKHSRDVLYADHIVECLDGLHRSDRIILVLKYLSGYSNEELERLLNISGVAVRQRLSRARKRLRDIIYDSGYLYSVNR